MKERWSLSLNTRSSLSLTRVSTRGLFGIILQQNAHMMGTVLPPHRLELEGSRPGVTPISDRQSKRSVKGRSVKQQPPSSARGETPFGPNLALLCKPAIHRGLRSDGLIWCLPVYREAGTSGYCVVQKLP